MRSVRPPPLVLGLVLHEEWSRRLAVEAMVGQRGIVSQQPVGHVIEGQDFMVIDGLFLDGEIEAFGMRAHVRGAGISPLVHDLGCIEALLAVAEALL